MKANELMIGDWVRCRKWMEKPFKLITLSERKGDFFYGRTSEKSIVGPFFIESLDPIPLTPEILEKNGFECRGALCLPGEDLGLRQDGDSWGLLSYYVEYDALAFCHIKYVHELQHALRLCGIEKEIEL